MDGKEQEMEDMDKSPFREDQAFTKKSIKPKIMRCFTLLTCVPTIDHMFPSFRVLYLLSFGLVFFFWRLFLWRKSNQHPSHPSSTPSRSPITPPLLEIIGRLVKPDQPGLRQGINTARTLM